MRNNQNNALSNILEQVEKETETLPTQQPLSEIERLTISLTEKQQEINRLEIELAGEKAVSECLEKQLKEQWPKPITVQKKKENSPNYTELSQAKKNQWTVGEWIEITISLILLFLGVISLILQILSWFYGQETVQEKEKEEQKEIKK